MKVQLSTQEIEDISTKVKALFLNNEGSHDWFHVERVFKTSTQLAKNMDADVNLAGLIALLHDIGDRKMNGENKSTAKVEITNLLDKTPISNRVNYSNFCDWLISEVEKISFGGSKNRSVPDSLEGKIVQDADRLDAIGAIGIARAFAYGGSKGRGLYDPNDLPRQNMSKEAYVKSNSPTINHFYEKLLLLKDRMNTTEGKKWAEQRHVFMEAFLQQFYNEWNGNQ